jgi:hypothetical protein
LFAAGAFDVVFTPVQMKKGRPGIDVRVLAPPSLLGALAAVVFAHSTTLGVRYHIEERLTLPRRMTAVRTPWGRVRVKVAGSQRTPEFDDLRACAERGGVSVATVRAAVEQSPVRGRPRRRR